MGNKEKFFAWKRYRDSPNFTRYQEYVKRRNQVTRKLRKVKREYERNLCKKIKKNAKAFYLYVNSRNKIKSPVSQLKCSNGEFTSNDAETATELNRFFQSVYVREDDKYLLWFNDFVHLVFDNEAPDPFNFVGTVYNDTLSNIHFTPLDVRDMLLSINPNKAVGPDEIHPRVLKETAEILYPPLFRIFRLSLDKGILPNVWKHANVSPIFKKGNRAEAGNYRPVSLTSQVCKVLEKMKTKDDQ